MKRTLVIVLCITLFNGLLNAQSFRGLDKSSMDMAYFPDNFAHDRKSVEKAVVRVIYSRPQTNGRKIFGALVPFNKVWRTGANEATEIKIYQDLEFGGKNIKAGTYSLFSIPGEKEWTIILNSDLDYWGAFSYNAKNDVIRVIAQPAELSNAVEHFTIQFESKGEKQGAMKLAWDKTSIEVPLKF